MTKTILCYGDSNTFGTMPMARLDDDFRFERGQRWPQVMAATLGTGYEVIAEGLPGRTTLHADPIEGAHLNGLAVLPAVLNSHRPLHRVIVMLGTNDLKHRFGLTAWDIAASVGQLASAIRGSGTGPDGGAPQVLVICPPPVIEVGCLGPMFEGGAAKSERLGAAMAEMATRMDLPMVDAGGVIASSPIDGIHFDAGAQITLGLAIAARVQQLDAAP